MPPTLPDKERAISQLWFALPHPLLITPFVRRCVPPVSHIKKNQKNFFAHTEFGLYLFSRLFSISSPHVSEKLKNCRV